MLMDVVRKCSKRSMESFQLSWWQNGSRRSYYCSIEDKYPRPRENECIWNYYRIRTFCSLT